MRQGVGSCPLLFSNFPGNVRETSSVTGDTGDVGESIAKNGSIVGGQLCDRKSSNITIIMCGNLDTVRELTWRPNHLLQMQELRHKLL